MDLNSNDYDLQTLLFLVQVKALNVEFSNIQFLVLTLLLTLEIEY